MIQTKEATTFEKYPEYKDSSVEWLGEIPEEWELKRFKYIAGTQKGKLPKHIVSENLNNEPPYMSMEYLRGGEENQWVLDKDVIVVDENETLLLWDGSNAGEFIKSRKGVISSTVAHISFKNINNRYAWYFSKKLEIELRKRTIGMGIPHVNGGFLNNSLVTIPFPQEQTAIVNFLDDKTSKIDTAIAQKEQMIALLKERKQIVIQNAVTGKWSIVNGQWAETPKEKMKDSGVEWIGEIPEHWAITKAKYYSKIFVPERAKPELNIKQEGYPWVTTELLHKNELFKRDVSYFVSESDKRKTGSRIIKANNVIATCVGNFGIAAKLNFDCIINQQLQGFTDLKINPYYLTFLIGLSKDYFENNSTLTTIMYVNKDTFGGMPIPLPNKKDQVEIVSYINIQTIKINQAITLQQSQIEKLIEYKATLIDGAVTGKIKVTDE